MNESEIEKEKRHTLAHERYQVTCSACGQLDRFQYKKDAFAYANRHKPIHIEHGKVQVFDCMAHKGAIELWTV